MIESDLAMDVSLLPLSTAVCLTVSIEYNASQLGKGGIVRSAPYQSLSAAAVGREDAEVSAARQFSGTKKPRAMPGLFGS
jgi:hypothetical protein